RFPTLAIGQYQTLFALLVAHAGAVQLLRRGSATPFAHEETLTAEARLFEDYWYVGHAETWRDVLQSDLSHLSAGAIDYLHRSAVWGIAVRFYENRVQVDRRVLSEETLDHYLATVGSILHQVPLEL